MSSARTFTSTLLIITFLISTDLLFSQTITSTTTGGRWNAAATWVGGVVPSTSNDVVIAGMVRYQNGDGSCRNLTVNAGATLLNQTGYAFPEQIITVNGNVTNNGTIRSDGNLFVMKIKGNIVNNGTWTFKRTELTGSGTQTISTSNKSKFENYFVVDAAAKPIIAAGSELTFTSAFELNKSSFDAKGFELTLYSENAGFVNGKVINVGTIVGKSSKNSEKYYFPILSDISYEGNTLIKGRFRIHNSLVFIGNVVNTDTLENLDGYAHPEKKFTVTGNFTNNGVIRNGGSAGLALNITGNVVNNGAWIHNRTELSGAANQTLSLGSGKLFESAFKVADLTGQIVAGSQLTFTTWVDLNKCAFDLKNYLLTLKGSSANISNGVVFNAADLVGRTTGANSYPVISNIIYDGKINLKGILRIDWGVTMRGSIVNTDTLENSTGYAHPEKTLKIIGDLTNNGLIRDGGSAGFVVDVTGNITANKKISNKRVQLAGSGNRTIFDKLSTVQYLSTGEKVSLVGINYLSNLSISANSKCVLVYGANIFVPNDNLDERLDNWSEISVTRKYSSSANYSFFKASINSLSSNSIDSVKIQSFGHQVPQTFAGAVKCWWRLTNYSKSPKQTFTTLTFRYNDDLLGSNTESNLQIYHSEDGGSTWKQLSTSTNVTRDLTNNSITLTDGYGYGDYLLSSSPDPASVVPSIVVSIIGRAQIRVGPPNRYTINYLNNSDIATGDFLLAINTGTNVHITHTEHILANGKRELIPADSLFYEKEDTTLVLYVAGLGAREERTFDIIATADNKGLFKSNRVNFIDPASITVATVAVWAAKAAVVYVAVKAIDYIGDKAKKGLELTPEQKKDWESRIGPIPEELKQKDTKKEWAAKKVGTKIIEKTMGIVGGGVDVVRAIGRNIWEIGPNLRRKIFSAIDKDLQVPPDEKIGDTSYKTEVSGINTKNTKRVTSWDPNEKVGPTGFGSKKFITTAGKMNYQILFENKKEATDAAYKIVIIDTLQSVFDPETVQFGKTSHEGDQYNWVISRNGNILKWEIEGIELPPNKVPPEGEGWVSFSVNTKNNLSSGTEIKNKATITFDINKPIQTNEYVNKLDFTAPTTIMSPLASSIIGNKLVLRWKSSDGADGSGVESSTVFMSIDKGPFELAGVSNSDSLLVNLMSGTHTYSFYAVSRDNVGNNETIKPTAVSTNFTNSIEKLGEDIPVSYSLDQNYPNPFNPETKIRFTLPIKSRVVLDVFNLLGERVRRLINQELDPSKYEINFDGKGLSSGIYLYRLTANGFIHTKKMLLLK